MVLRSVFEYLASRMRFIPFVLELNGAVDNDKLTQLFESFFWSCDGLNGLDFLCYKKGWCAPLGAVNLLYNLKSLESIEFLFEREFTYAWNRKRFSMIWFCIWFKFNIIGLTMPFS